MRDFVIDMWGDMACWTPPYARVERISWPVPTPSGIKGVLTSIYGKPEEFHWEVRKIEVMNPIKYLPVKRNEIKTKMPATKNPEPILIEDKRTQRMTVYLKDVRYRITAIMCPHKPGEDFEVAIRKQALRRITKGSHFAQPYFGMRECICNYALADMDAEPIHETRDCGLMVYDTHNPWDKTVGGSSVETSLYRAIMVDGVITVPPYDSPEVLKIGGEIHV